MSSNKPSSFGTSEEIERAWKFFRDEKELLKEAQQIIMVETDVVWVVTKPLLHFTQQTSDSILILSRYGHMRDCFVLARTVFETIVNICFICAKGEETASRAIRHAKQKAYRDLHREVEISHLKITLSWTGEIDLDANPDLKQAVEEFTSKKGREITSWTPETVKEQLDVIAAHYPDSAVGGSLLTSFVTIYRHASEFAHGTFFGAMFALGDTVIESVVHSQEEFTRYQGENFTMLLMMLGCSVEALLVIFATELPSMQDLGHKADKIMYEYLASVTWKHEENTLSKDKAQ